MRYYNVDGTYKDHPYDTEFGWFCEDISIDEATPRFEEENTNIREISRLNRKWRRTCETNELNDSNTNTSSFISQIEESVDVLQEPEYYAKSTFSDSSHESLVEICEFSPDPTKIQKIELNIDEEIPTNYKVSLNTVEGFIENPESNFTKLVKTCQIPAKEDMMSLINPVNPESKALLSVISYTRYSRLNDKETTEDVMKTINFKTTNSKYFLRESPFGEHLPKINFQLSGSAVDLDKQIASEIRTYHATKEDNMLSLMMELINTDLDSNLGDMSELNNSINEFNTIGTGYVETSDLGNSIHSSILSKDANKGEKRHVLDIPNRSDILSSIGLSDEIDKSIEYFVQEKAEMHQQLIDIKKSFEADEKKIDSLMSAACALESDLRQTTYLINLLHLLNSNPEKVKNKKFPFRIFQHSGSSSEHNEGNMNLII
ncbi:unnamed protein product [Ceutorhynchus assimilis]|uniref:Uncharacterized protein n=1 Tax=Ceutorhynchus assimilis TaxID=467358 RepID=A0A9P0DJ70_9CUCU|nr:unnamed protein product [Ceutorhynchus assimilis]